MVQITSFENTYYYPSPQLREGLDALLRFPDGEFKRDSIPNSSILVYNPTLHKYNPEILSGDAGCGIAAFFIDEVNPKEAANIIFEKLNRKGILGRGNHFVDICGAYESAIPNTKQKYPHNILLVHTHGDNQDITIPATIAEAQKRQQYAEDFREYLGHQLATDIGSRACELLGNWTHNSVEETEEGIIYRKGVVKVQPQEIHILPANIGEKILFYTVSNEAPFRLPPYSSMPHATGRAGPRGKMKVSIDEIKKMRRQKGMPYIPLGISDTALRSEHPSCFNNFERIFKSLKYQVSENFTENYFIVTAEARILSYVGKV